MSRVLISQYLNELSTLRQVGGTHRESVVREAFKDLLKGWARSHDMTFVPEYEIESPARERRYVDGALLYGLRLPFGYWEAKDEKDDLDAEIEVKQRRGYPNDNIIYEDSREAVLIQNKREVMRCPVDNVERLQRLLELFFGYERPEIAEFRKAVEQFKNDLPAVCKALREMIEHAYADNEQFRIAADHFLKQAQESINPRLTEADVREILIQHILTEEIFALVFPGTTYHEDNNIARELYKLEATFFTGNTKHQTLRGLEPYYVAIRRTAGQISSHHEKQTFLKVVYENFYKVYNPKAADRLGVVYTPNEIVRFMIESTDRLCEQHFGRNLIDKDVEILDPAAGTGTFISELLEHFRGQQAKLKHKYLEELHANEVAILPYYVANLNIEATFAAVTGEYVEYPNLCFVDTLDNVAGLRRYTGHQVGDLFGMGEENIERIKRQNRRKISVVIGNPPYNANQANENDNNKNREYPDIDARIKETYIRASIAQKTKLYDMYARFFRWASDRIAENGVVAFVTNSSFLKKKTFDGFRRTVGREFQYGYIVDLGGEMREGDSRGNVFGITVGVAISFWIKKQGGDRNKLADIRYHCVPRALESSERLSYLTRSAADLQFEPVSNIADGDWFPVEDQGFSEGIPIANKRRGERKAKSLFQVWGVGISTNRDDWVYDLTESELARKIRALAQRFEAARLAGSFDESIKWSRNLKRRMAQGRNDDGRSRVIAVQYRPYTKKFLYDSPLFVDERGKIDDFFPTAQSANPTIVVSDPTSQKQPMCLAVSGPFDLHLVGAGAGAVGFPLRIKGEENITNWGFEQFRKNYMSGRARKDRQITKEAIFHYVYAVLNDPGLSYKIRSEPQT
jgi:predicted helicase